MKRFFFLAVLVAGTLPFTVGCATKKYVRNEVTPTVNKESAQAGAAGGGRRTVMIGASRKLARSAHYGPTARKPKEDKPSTVRNIGDPAPCPSHFLALSR